MKKSVEKIEAKPYKPALKELRLAAVAERLDLPEHADYVYWALVNVLSASHAGIHVDKIVEWFDRLAKGDAHVEGAILTWARTVRDMPAEITDAVRVLGAEGLITTEVKTLATPEGETYERTKVTMLPVEEWENDTHFLAGLALRMPATKEDVEKLIIVHGVPEPYWPIVRGMEPERAVAEITRVAVQIARHRP